MDQDQEDEGPAPLSATEAVERHGWPSEVLGPVPRAGGPECARAMARVAGWRAEAEQQEDIRATVAAAEGGANSVDRAIAVVERAIADLERYAQSDLQATGMIEPARRARLDGLRARRDYMRSLTHDRCPPPPI